jgi:hypothetical protein
MKLTITNNGKEPFFVAYSDMYRLYNEDDYENDSVVLQPDTSVTIDNVEEILEIKPLPEGVGDDSEEDFSMDDLRLDEDDSDENNDEDSDDLLLEESDSDDQDVTLSQEDFDLIEQEADKPSR